MSEILVIDDDSSIRNHLQKALSKKGYGVVTVENALKGLDLLKNGFSPSVVILDMMMPEMDGLEALTQIKQIDDELPVIILSGVNSPKSIVEAMRLGAYDYLTKPFQSEEIEVVLQNVLDKKNLVDEVKRLRKEIDTGAANEFFIHTNERMAEIKEIIAQIADTDVTVLIQGESGVGKEIIARTIHMNSNRYGKLFVKVNCAAIPGELLESELFGFEKGAFTGAVRQKPGKFEFAHGGTIFLDEISELSFPLQGKLLHVLQEGEFSRLGGKEEVRVDVRVLAATNKDLEELARRGDFREDLYYRLNVIRIDVPPLRERRDEIPLLCQHFFQKYSGKYNSKVKSIPEDLVELFLQYDWPGNIREMENIIKRYLILADKEAIRREILSKVGKAQAQQEPELVPVAVGSPAVQSHSSINSAEPKEINLKEKVKAATMEAERHVISQALRTTNYNRKKAAALLKISYKALLYKMKAYNL